MGNLQSTVYPKKYAHGFVVLCFVVVMQSFIINSHDVFIHIHQGGFAGTGAIARLPQCQWSKSDGYGKISQCITTTKHSKAKTVCIFLGIYCICLHSSQSLKFTTMCSSLFGSVERYGKGRPLWMSSWMCGHLWCCSERASLKYLWWEARSMGTDWKADGLVILNIT